MLSHEENDLLTRVTGDAPMGKLMRQHWTPVCLIEEVAEADGNRCLLKRLVTVTSRFATQKASLDCLTSFARIDVRLLCSVVMRIADCAAFIMDGNSTLKATALPCRPNLKAARFTKRSNTNPIKLSSGVDLSGRGLAKKKTCIRFLRPLLHRPKTRRFPS